MRNSMYKHQQSIILLPGIRAYDAEFLAFTSQVKKAFFVTLVCGFILTSALGTEKKPQSLSRSLFNQTSVLASGDIYDRRLAG